MKITKAQAGRIGGSKPKHYSEEELAKRRKRMKAIRKDRGRAPQGVCQQSTLEVP